jgi:heptosyltransferase-3
MTFIGIAMDGDLGDMVASEPILPALAAKFGHTHITWICNPKHFPVYQFHPLVNRLLPQQFTLLTQLLLRLNPFHHFYSLHLSGFRQDSVTKTIIRNPKADALNLTLTNYYDHHTLLEVASLLADLGKLNEQPHVYLDPEADYVIPKGVYWVIHTKSNEGLRDWKDEHWIRLINYAMETWAVQIIEIGHVNPLPFEHPSFSNLVGKTTLMETMKIIQGASFFMGLDSGPTHIANSFQIPALILCGAFKNFNRYHSYSGAYQNPDIAQVLFNPIGKTEGLDFESVKNALEIMVSKTQKNLEK